MTKKQEPSGEIVVHVNQEETPPYKQPCCQAINSYNHERPGLFKFVLLSILVGGTACLFHLALFEDKIDFKVTVSTTANLQAVNLDSLSGMMPHSVFTNVETKTVNARQEIVLDGFYQVNNLEYYIYPAAVICLWQWVLNLYQLGNKFDMCFFFANLVRLVGLTAGIIFQAAILQVVEEDAEEFADAISGSVFVSSEVDTTNYEISMACAAAAVAESVIDHVGRVNKTSKYT
eukprot:snap_masked-scaffold_7-processed-gene-4.18-mRNA-1 protein AED:1.00 eAED:1.00 QI:0/0/0/0/1/1/2/0/231